MIQLVSENGAKIEAPVIVNADAVAHLERLLERAQAGQLTSLAFVASGPHLTDRGYCGIEDVGEAIYLLGSLTRLERLVQERADTLSAPVEEFHAP